MSIPLKKTILFFGFALLLFQTSRAQVYDSTLFNCARWRMIGPFRGGRTVGATGNPKEPNVFYIGVNNGGIWKTTDYGRTWQPVFDAQPTGSIGDVMVAPSNPDVVYAASGEGLQRPDLSVGDGMYKSSDAGKCWKHIGLTEGKQIGGIAVDPKNENTVFAAVLGHPYGPNTERGIFKTTDGGASWKKVLYVDENTGAVQVSIDPSNPAVVYADMWAGRQGPWENGQWEGAGSNLYKSTDGGASWKILSKGLPTHAQGLGRIGFCIAPSNTKRLYAVVNSTRDGGLYRSDDAGESWILMNGDLRLYDRGDDFAELKADPKNEDIVYNANVMVSKSVDGGKTWTGFRGAPGGDDYHRFWINPLNPQIMLLAGDQGAIITVNGGETWSSWYNQPTAQLYHVSADNAFPYNVYSGQQESGSVGIASRGNDGAITLRDWHPVSAEEYGYVVADPLDPNIVIGGKLTKYDKRTGQAQDISPEAVKTGQYRFLRTAPIAFSPVNNKTLYYAGNVIFKSQDLGNSWEVISPDLSRTSYTVPASIGIYRTDSMKTMRRRGVVYTLALSPLDSNTIWAGTDDGLIQLTRDGGKHWTDVTPPALGCWSKVSLMEASHTDVNTAYAAVNCIRLDDYTPHIYRTRDGGKTWTEIIRGLPADPINVVKEDPIRPGMLFAGSERSTWLSFDSGDHWQSLRLNMPATSIRDLVIKDNDLVVATHGRSFWILDDIAALRQLKPELTALPVVLYKPSRAYRIRWDLNPDTPVPQEEPAGKNPPEGAIIDYFLKEKVQSELTLDIVDAKGKTLRHYSSKEQAYKIPMLNIPLYWIRPQQFLSAEAGSHRFLWDMHYQPLEDTATFPMAAVYAETERAPTGPWVMPGVYTVRLTVNGKTYSQSLELKMDPRIKTTQASLQVQHDLSVQCYEDMQKCSAALQQAEHMNDKLIHFLSTGTAKQKEKLQAFQQKLLELKGGGRKKNEEHFVSCSLSLKSVFDVLQNADVQPTTQCIHAAELTHRQFEEVWKKWEGLLTEGKGLGVF